MDAVGNDGDELIEECSGCGASGAGHQSGEGELAGPVDGHKEVKLALGGLHLGNVDVNRRSAQRKNPMG